jgi:hypothetical protein
VCDNPITADRKDFSLALNRILVKASSDEVRDGDRPVPVGLSAGPAPVPRAEGSASAPTPIACAHNT